MKDIHPALSESLKVLEKEKAAAGLPQSKCEFTYFE
jgi:hypothetical protein